ncbi:hypothetical protein EC991_005761 [Linnemannia zychae]|nr:hypothetical protein EC991_005761 [Linnemannia zychae]
MHHITRQLQKEQQMQQQKHQYRETPYRRDSHMEHYMSDILAAPAPAAIAEEPLETKGLCDLSMEDLTHRLEEIKHLQGALSAQSNSRGDRPDLLRPNQLPLTKQTLATTTTRDTLTRLLEHIRHNLTSPLPPAQHTTPKTLTLALTPVQHPRNHSPTLHQHQ